MYIRILGSAAGGGFPQWNCGCDTCAQARRGDVPARTQSSIAVSTDKRYWLLFNASPDIRAQLLAYPELGPGDQIRGSGVKATFLMDAQLDHASGLLFMRESHLPLDLYCTRRVHEDLTTGYPLLPTLSHYCGLEFHEVGIHEREDENIPFTPVGFPDLEIKALPLSGKAPPYSPNRGNEAVGDNIYVRITDKRTARSLIYAPGVGEIPPGFDEQVASAEMVLIEGNFWHEDDMARSGCGKKTAADMGHVHLAGDDGLMQYLDRFENTRKMLIHINNTNPILRAGSVESRELREHHIEVADDGMLLEI